MNVAMNTNNLNCMLFIGIITILLDKVYIIQTLHISHRISAKPTP